MPIGHRRAAVANGRPCNRAWATTLASRRYGDARSRSQDDRHRSTGIAVAAPGETGHVDRTHDDRRGSDRRPRDRATDLEVGPRRAGCARRIDLAEASDLTAHVVGLQPSGPDGAPPGRAPAVPALDRRVGTPRAVSAKSAHRRVLCACNAQRPDCITRVISATGHLRRLRRQGHRSRGTVGDLGGNGATVGERSAPESDAASDGATQTTDAASGSRGHGTTPRPMPGVVRCARGRTRTRTARRLFRGLASRRRRRRATAPTGSSLRRASCTPRSRRGAQGQTRNRLIMGASSGARPDPRRLWGTRPRGPPRRP